MPSHSTLKRPFTHTLLFFSPFICSSPANIIHDNFQATGALYGNSSWLPALRNPTNDYNEMRTNEGITQVLGCMFVYGPFNHCLDSWELECLRSRKEGEKQPKQHLLFLQGMNKGERFLNWAQQKNQHLPILRSFPQPSGRFLFKAFRASQILAASSQDRVRALQIPQELEGPAGTIRLE